MEQGRYLMWTRRKLSGKPHHPAFASATASYSYSWEEQAFAEDSAGRFGGCVWPPRSYSCSFCRREFRSAQALGGHMNVHRRDRARLKLSPTSHVEGTHHLLHHHQQQQQQQQQPHLPNPCPPLPAKQHPSQVCAPGYDNYIPNPSPTHGAVASPLSPSRVSVPSTLKNSCERTLVSPSYSSSLAKESSKGCCLLSIPLSQSEKFSLRILTAPELKAGREDLKLKEMGCGDERVAADKEDDEEGISSKRRRIDVTIPFLVRSPTSGGSPPQIGVLGLSPSPVDEELDLELRLGYRPKVK